jgi:hypothetical protein
MLQALGDHGVVWLKAFDNIFWFSIFCFILAHVKRGDRRCIDALYKQAKGINSNVENSIRMWQD